MKFYIASSFRNVDSVRNVTEKLKNKGHVLTYDWTGGNGEKSLNDLREIGMKERNAVIEADIVIVLLPAGRGSHIEFGIALGQDKKIYLYSPDEDALDVEKTTTFYHLPEVQLVIGTLDELIERIS